MIRELVVAVLWTIAIASGIRLLGIAILMITGAWRTPLERSYRRHRRKWHG